MTNLPPTFTEETKQLFYQSLPDIYRFGEDRDFIDASGEVLHFIHSRESAAYDLGRAETLKEVREMCEGMRYENDSFDDTKIYNAALSNLITRLTQ